MQYRTLFAAASIAVVTPMIASAQKFVGTSGIVTVSAPVKLDTAGMFQSTFVSVGDDMFIGGQPTERALREMKARGVTTVVNLRTPEEMQRSVKFDEPALIRELGMKYVYLPVRGTADFPYSPETVTKFADAVRGTNGKVLLHCTVAWRASHLWAAYLIKERGVAAETALVHARAINLGNETRVGPGDQPIEDFLGRKVPQLGKP